MYTLYLKGLICSNTHLISHDFCLNNLCSNVIKIFFGDFLCRNHNRSLLFFFSLWTQAAVCFGLSFYFLAYAFFPSILFFPRRWSFVISILLLLSPPARGPGAWSVTGMSFAAPGIFFWVKVPCGWRHCWGWWRRTLELSSKRRSIRNILKPWQNYWKFQWIIDNLQLLIYFISQRSFDVIAIF